MSRTRNIGGKYTEIIGGDYNIYSEGDIVYNSTKTINFTAENGVTFGSPKAAPPANLATLHVKVRLKEPENYKGEFGFDWVDADLETKDIQKIQGVDFANVEYFYKENSNPAELGTIVEKNTDEAGANSAIKAKYNFNSVGKHIDLPYVLIKPLQEITLLLEVNKTEGTITDDEIAITGDAFYEFEIVGGEKEGKITKKKLAEGEKLLDLKIKCLAEAPREIKYEFSHTSATTAKLQVGGVVMMENKVLKLKFRVIALVSADGAPNDKAKALFKKFKDAGVKDYLNKNSLNQAGYEVEIENFNEMDNADVDDYFYAFDKTDWTTKKYFGIVTKQKYDLIPGTNTCKRESWDSVLNVCKKVPVQTEVIVDDQKDIGASESSISNEIDAITIKEYRAKLKTKDKSYDSGGIIILCDYESPTQTWAFSRTNPLNHYGVFVYSDGVDSKDTYAHEIGHMLGLPHAFHTDKEKQSYKTARENILGNGLPENIIVSRREVPNPECILSMDRKISKNRNDNSGSYNSFTTLMIEKTLLLECLREYNSINTTRLNTINYTNEAAQSIRSRIEKNRTVINIYRNSNDCSFKQYDCICYMDKIGYGKYLNRLKKYYNDIIEQVHLNILFYKQNTTKNFLDYYNNNIRSFYTHNQIKIMRDDSKNFIEEICRCR